MRLQKHEVWWSPRYPHQIRHHSWQFNFGNRFYNMSTNPQREAVPEFEQAYKDLHAEGLHLDMGPGLGQAGLCVCFQGPLSHFRKGF